MNLERVVKLLALVPEPHIAAAAAIVGTILEEVRRDPLTIPEGEGMTQALAKAVAAASEPWRRIKARAEGELRHDMSGTIRTGELD